jgi:hypothetical protein
MHSKAREKGRPTMNHRIKSIHQLSIDGVEKVKTCLNVWTTDPIVLAYDTEFSTSKKLPALTEDMAIVQSPAVHACINGTPASKTF